MTGDALPGTRRSLHGIAEHVLAAHQRRLTGSIRLGVTARGLRTAALAVGDGLELRATALYRERDGLTAPLAGSMEKLARAVDVEFGLPDPPYSPASGVGPDDVVDVDPASTELILSAWRRGDAALRELGDRYAEAAAPVPVVWPEHLDVAVTLDEVNYGVSPGDAYSAVPYAYVGPHRPGSGPFWNAPFGAARPLSRLPTADDVLAFFERGRAEAGAPPR